ncbi:Uncharacterized protein Adt_31468 [Abeliophyllum distichum]|uniref:Protein FAR1-RELATED SEQUENCE n=1 Tax=Abeliophyllum distichum TaxID=126358 RepID=A0ABD1RFI4_9LAMI
MNGQAPNGIITDQDRAMQNAIHIVFPTTRHRWCLWHIMKKLPEKFGSNNHKSFIFSAIHTLVYDSQSPAYCSVHSKTSLKLFVEQYERAMRSKVEKEFHADFKSYSQMVPCATKYEMEKQFQEIYTIAKFREFQQEFTRKVYCEVISTQEGCFGTDYEVPSTRNKSKKLVHLSSQPSMQPYLPVSIPNLGNQFQPWSHCYGVNSMPTFQLDRNLSVPRHIVDDALYDIADDCTSTPMHRLNM